VVCDVCELLSKEDRLSAVQCVVIVTAGVDNPEKTGNTAQNYNVVK